MCILLGTERRIIFAVHYVKDGPKVDSTSSPEPQYATCSAPVEYDYVTGL